GTPGIVPAGCTCPRCVGRGFCSSANATSPRSAATRDEDGRRSAIFNASPCDGREINSRSRSVRTRSCIRWCAHSSERSWRWVPVASNRMRSIGSWRRGTVRRRHRSRHRTVSPWSASSTAGPFVGRPEADRLRSSHGRSAATRGTTQIVEPHGTPPSIDDRRYVFDGYIDDCQYVHTMRLIQEIDQTCCPPLVGSPLSEAEAERLAEA